MFKKSLALACLIGFSAIGLPAHAAAPMPVTNPDTAMTNFIAPENIDVLANDSLSGTVSNFRLVTEFGDIAAGKTFPNDGFTVVALNSSGGNIMVTPSGNKASTGTVSYGFDLTDEEGLVTPMTGTLTVEISANGVPLNPMLAMRTTTVIDGYGTLTFDSLNRTKTFVDFTGSTSEADGAVACLPSLAFLDGCLVATDGAWSFSTLDELPVEDAAPVTKPSVVPEKPVAKVEVSKPIATDVDATTKTLTAAPSADKLVDKQVRVVDKKAAQERSGDVTTGSKNALSVDAPNTKAATAVKTTTAPVKPVVSKPAPVKAEVASVDAPSVAKAQVVVPEKPVSKVVLNEATQKPAAAPVKSPVVSEVLVTDAERTASTEVTGTQKESMNIGLVVIGFLAGAFIGGLAILGLRTGRPKN